MGITQYKVGKSWEQEIMEYYNKKNYFAYKFPTEFSGTICDIILIKNSACMMVECKHTTGEKLYYKGCGIYKKRDEIDNFVKKYNTNVYIMIKSDKLGIFWTSWINAKPIFESQGYLDLKKDCFKGNMEVK